MAENSRIEWTTHTFNAWTGCAKVSPACRFCYAESWDKRFNDGDRWGVNAARPVTSDANWRKPLAWDRAAAAAGRRDRVFCASLADVFEARDDLIQPRARLWRLIEATPNLDWLLLTKRPENMLSMIPWGINPWPNVWLGTTVEDQQRADERIPILLDTPAAVRFLSCEPLLGPVDLNEAACPWEQCWGTNVDWVICGGESGGRHARPMQQEWARSLRDQCQAAGVVFHFKQWGSHDADGNYVGASGKSAGRDLDGRTWDELPEVCGA